MACQDRWTGKAAGVVLHGAAFKANHLVVRHGLLFPKSYAVPWSQVASWGEEEVRLAVTAETLFRMPAPSKDPQRLLTGATPVISKDHHLLRLGGVTLDVASGDLVRLLVRSPGLASGRLVPVKMAHRETKGQVTLRLSREELHRLPRFQPDSYIHRQVEYILYDHDGEEGLDASAISIAVQEGVVTLSGNVRADLASRLAARLASSMAGVVEVETQIMSDWDVQLAASKAIVQDSIAPQGVIMVNSSLGRVRLEGMVSDQETAERAIRVVNDVPGVREVVRLIHVEPMAKSEGSLPADRAMEPEAASTTPAGTTGDTDPSGAPDAETLEASHSEAEEAQG